jgi:hypothetical protein
MDIFFSFYEAASFAILVCALFCPKTEAELFLVQKPEAIKIKSVWIL